MRVTQTEMERERERAADRAGEVVREMDFAGCV